VRRRDRGVVIIWVDRQIENFGVETCQGSGLPAVDDDGFQVWHVLILARVSSGRVKGGVISGM
jgi:hypothetical protein